MPRFCANIEFLFRERPLLERLGAARAAGFRAIEIPWPYEAELDEFDEARRKADVAVVEFNIPTGDIQSGGYGLASVPGREKQFRAAVEVGREWALRLECRNLHVLAGFQAPWVSRDDAMNTFIANVGYAADRLADDGISVLVEACNRRERPGFVIGTTNDALAAVQRAGRQNAKIEHDLYHLQIAEGDLIDRMRKVVDFIGHIQFADVPGRREPGTGEINFSRVFAAIDEMGYSGWCGAEYYPTTARTEDSLGWFAPYRDQQNL